MTDTPPQREELRERLKRVLNPVYACPKHDFLDCPQCIYNEAEHLIHTEAKRQSIADRLELIESLRMPEDRTFSMDDAKTAWDAATRSFNTKLTAAKRELEAL